MDDHSFRDTMLHFLDGMSVALAVGTLVGMLPAISAGLSCVWLALRIYETATVQKALKRIRRRDS